MPSSGERRYGKLAILALGINVLAVFALVVIGTLYLAGQTTPAAANPPLLTKGTARPTFTPAPTSFYLPSITPNAQATLVEDYSSPTPFIFPDGPAPGVIGYSVEGRPINVYTFGQGETNYLIIAGIHGGYEGNTVDLANQLLVYLNAHPETVPGSAKLYIIPDMNPDAVARGRNAGARVNANGVDLNRNFPTPNWVANWDHSKCWNDVPTTGGTAPGSEPETRAVINFILGHHIEALISYHSAALGVFPGGDPWQPASMQLAAMLSGVTDYPYPPVDIGCVYTGTLADWAVESGVPAAVDMELADHRNTDFAKNLRALQVLANFYPN